MHLVCLLDELANDLGLSDKNLSRVLGLDERTVAKIRADTENWRISRRQLENLWRFAADHGLTHGLFELREHPLWDSFRDCPSVIFRSSLEIDADVEKDLQQFLRQLNSSCEVRTDVSDIDVIEKEMRKKNTVFLGSPKANPASEVALALLYKCEPFSSGKHRTKVPLRFLGMEPTHREQGSSFLVDGPPYGIEIVAHGRQKPIRVTVDWLPVERYWPHKGEGVDAGVAVVCPQPLGTHKPVRSIVVAGYTGLATKTLAHELTYGEPAIYAAELATPGVPREAILRFRFYKRPARQSQGQAELRRVIDDSKQWGPPWPRIERDI